MSPQSPVISTTYRTRVALVGPVGNPGEPLLDSKRTVEFVGPAVLLPLWGPLWGHRWGQGIRAASDPVRLG
jgi:hypothetical protein